MIENPSNLTQQLLNLVERVAVEIRAIYNKLQTAVFKVNGQIPDSEGNIQIDVVTKATQDGNGNVISNTYVKKTDKVTSASSADSAIKATQDGSGNVITSTYATKSELNAIDVGVKTVNGTQPDPNGNVTIQTGGDTSNLVPKTGDRGVLAGYETLSVGTVVNQDSPDFQTAGNSFVGETPTFNTVTVENGTAGTSWIKCVNVLFASSDIGGTGFSVTLGDMWLWSGQVEPTLGMASAGIVVCVWLGDMGYAFYCEAISQ